VVDDPRIINAGAPARPPSRTHDIWAATS